MNKTLAPLLQIAAEETRTALWCLDDGNQSTLTSLAGFDGHRVLTNRIDVADAATTHGILATFNDWQLTSTNGGAHDSNLNTVFLPVMKEKPVTHHLINQSFSALALGGTLHLAGEKNQGIKTVFEKAAALFGSRAKLKKFGDVYVGQLTKRSNTCNAFLDTQHYETLREITVDGQTFWSKPGVFGWNKIDAGSKLLLETFYAHYPIEKAEGKALLDLGCGWGHLISETAHFPFVDRMATDNNAAAIRCTKQNLAAKKIEGQVIASNCADIIKVKSDVILCNPPFHQGFDVASELGHRFVRATHRLLKGQDSRAFFVVNSFIGIEKIAGKHFTKVDTLANDKRFKVVMCTGKN